MRHFTRTSKENRTLPFGASSLSAIHRMFVKVDGSAGFCTGPVAVCTVTTGLDDHVLPSSNENSTRPPAVLADPAMYAVPAGILSDGVRCSAGSEPLFVPVIVQRTTSPVLSFWSGTSGVTFSPPLDVFSTVAPLKCKTTSGRANAAVADSATAARHIEIERDSKRFTFLVPQELVHRRRSRQTLGAPSDLSL